MKCIRILPKQKGPKVNKPAMRLWDFLLHNMTKGPSPSSRQRYVVSCSDNLSSNLQFPRPLLLQDPTIEQQLNNWEGAICWGRVWEQKKGGGLTSYVCNVLLVVKVNKYWFGEMSKYFASHFAVQKHGVILHWTPQMGSAVSAGSFICFFLLFLRLSTTKPQHFTASEAQQFMPTVFIPL